MLEGLEKGMLEGLEKGMLEGLEKGLLEGQREYVLDILDLRFDPVPSDVIEAVRQITDHKLLKKLHRAAVQVATLEEFCDLY